MQWAGKQYSNAVLANKTILKQKAWAVTTAYVFVVVLILALILLRLFCAPVGAHTLSNG